MQQPTPLALAIVSFCGIYSASLSAQAQPLRVNIPFEFSDRGVTMPAGEYTVSFSTDSQGMLQVSHAAGSHESVFNSTYNQAYSAPNDPATLTFNRHGNQYFLKQVARGHGGLIYRLPTSRAEREIVKAASSPPVEEVTIVAGLTSR